MTALPFTTSTTKVYISTSVLAEPADAAAYAALTWTEIGSIETIGEFGDEANIATINIIGAGRINKNKGSRDAGTLALTVADIADDTGQAALIAAEATKFDYPFKIVTPNRLTTGGTDGIDYFIALVASKRRNIGGADNIVRRTFNLAVNSKVTPVAPT